MSFTNECKKVINNINDSNVGYIFKNSNSFDISYCNKIVTVFNNLFTRQNDEIKALTTKIDDISKQFAEYRKTTTTQITELQTLNKTYQSKLDEAIIVINKQIKQHEENIIELVNKIKIEQEAIKKQIEEHLKLNKVVSDTNENYADLATQFANLVNFLRYILTDVNEKLPELALNLDQLSLSI